MTYDIELLDNGADDPMNAPKLRGKLEIGCDSIRIAFDGFGHESGNEWLVCVEQLDGVPRALVSGGYRVDECDIFEFDDCVIPPGVEN